MPCLLALRCEIATHSPHESAVDPKRWAIGANPAALRSLNPIRRAMESMPTVQGRGKKPISLTLGDPCAFGEIKAPQVAVQALTDAISGFHYNGYSQAAGIYDCRSAVAEFLSKDLPYSLSADDIFMTAGCSQAIQFCIGALANSEKPSNMLLPRPGFPLYQSFCNLFGVEVREYDLLPNSDWEVDLRGVERLVDPDTAAIVLCNPGNPCGSVYTPHHLTQVAKLAGKLRVPIIADEIYAHMAFEGSKFVPMGAFASHVPVLTVGGISKRWFVPGWRLGWLSVCDPDCVLKEAKVLDAFTNLAQMHLSTCTPIQAALPKILQNTPQDFFSQTLDTLSTRADLCYERAQKTPGLSCPSKPRGSMYIMIRIDSDKFKDLRDDKEFALALAKEEALGVLPGSAFGFPGWIRLLFAAPETILDESWDRLEAFCTRHTK
ncbi:probable aminotransferase TAT2 [Selaginella moellendorffii]|uniref:probable aminotransferase TAT2 n=1 Tax=Selaginella moellendorffii TaxID=88036 RepID=UPI000D1C3D1E|nr:probable aminotransferase TAT2 [Selaginella moellendorffii]|eukprot:XP_024536669.1 probable aminotransferase TAT2 [Selaginella moellendorffii]